MGIWKEMVEKFKMAQSHWCMVVSGVLFFGTCAGCIFYLWWHGISFEKLLLVMPGIIALGGLVAISFIVGGEVVMFIGKLLVERRKDEYRHKGATIGVGNVMSLLQAKQANASGEAKDVLEEVIEDVKKANGELTKVTK